MNALALINNQNGLINNQNLISNQNNNVNLMGGLVGKISSKWLDINANIQMTNKFILQIGGNTNEINKSIDTSAKKSGSFLDKVKELGKTVFSLSNAKLVFDATIGGAAKAKEQLIGFQNLMGNKEVGEEYLNKVSKQSIKNGFSPDDAVNNTRGFMKVTKNTDKLDKLNEMSARLATTNPEKGVGHSGGAIKNAMSGKFDELQNNFNFSDADTQILKSSKSLDDFMSKMDTMLNKKGLTAENLVDFSKSPMAQFDSLKANIESSFSDAGSSALDSLTPILEKLNAGFDSGSFDMFFTVLSNGLNIISGLVSNLFDFISWIAGVVQENWGVIEPILVGVAAVILGLLVMSIMQMAFAWIMATWPILLIIGIVALLINAFVQCGVSAEEIIGFIGGLFGVLWAGIYNGIAFVWNIIASFAEFFANVLKDPARAIINLLQNIWGAFAKLINKMLDGMKKIPVIGDLVKDYSVSTKISFLPEMGENPDNFYKAPRMELKNYDNEFKYGTEKAKKMRGMLTNVNKKLTPDLSAYNSSQKDNFQMPSDKLQNNFNTTNENLQNGNDKIDISNEHLEMLRDLAEIESVQNFVTLTPSVEITTGDIKEEADINTIISKIENYMKTELVNSAEGVYV